MIDPERDDLSTSLDSEDGDATQDDAAVASPESADRASVEAREQRLLNRLAEQGRRTQAAEQRAADAAQAAGVLAQRLQTLEQQQQRVGAYLSQEQQRQNEAYLASLPPERRLEVKVQQLERQIAGAQRQPMPPQPTAPRQPTPQEIEQRKQEILQEVNLEFNTQLTGQELHVDVSGADAYRASLRAIAAYGRDDEVQEAPVAKKAAAKTPSAAEISEQVERRVLQELGVTRSSAPNALAGIASAPDSDVQKIVRSKGSHQSKLAALRKAAGRD